MSQVSRKSGRLFVLIGVSILSLLISLIVPRMTTSAEAAMGSNQITKPSTYKHLRQPGEQNDAIFYETRDAGYVPSGNGGYQRVSATWTVPCIASDSPAGSSSIWVGLGVTSQMLVQAGTHQERKNSTDTYYAWIQNVSTGVEEREFDVRCGDFMFASIQAPNQMFIIDLSTKNYASEAYGNAADMSTAGFIVERPRSVVNGVSTVPPLVNFGSVTFSNCRVTTTAGTVLALGQTDYDQYLMTRTGQPPSPDNPALVSVGPIDPFVGQTFTVTWHLES